MIVISNFNNFTPLFVSYKTTSRIRPFPPCGWCDLVPYSAVNLSIINQILNGKAVIFNGSQQWVLGFGRKFFSDAKAFCLELGKITSPHHVQVQLGTSPVSFSSQVLLLLLRVTSWNRDHSIIQTEPI